MSRDVEQHRDRLFGIAYRMLGSAAEAEDVVQEAFLRWVRTDHRAVDNPGAWLTTVVARLCIDQLRSARVARTEYRGPWLPEPIETDAPIDASSVSIAFLSLLERLSPPERAVYLLHHVFDHSFSEVAAITGKTEANCRQIFRRAKQHLAQGRPRFESAPEQHHRVVQAFLVACGTGDLEPIQALLADDVTLWSDGGGKVQAVSRPLSGATPVARFFAGLKARAAERARMEIRDVNGEPAIVIFVADAPNTVLTIESDGARIRGIRAIRNPDKLASFGRARLVV